MFKCQWCGRFFPYADIENGVAKHYLYTPDSDYSCETYKTVCKRCVTNSYTEQLKRYGLEGSQC